MISKMRAREEAAKNVSKMNVITTVDLQGRFATVLR
jgi:hypothetical protein